MYTLQVAESDNGSVSVTFSTSRSKTFKESLKSKPLIQYLLIPRTGQY